MCQIMCTLMLAKYRLRSIGREDKIMLCFLRMKSKPDTYFSTKMNFLQVKEIGKSMVFLHNSVEYIKMMAGFFLNFENISTFLLHSFEVCVKSARG